MKIYNSLSDFKTAKKTIVTLGTFDGVHIGHQKILEKLLQNAKKYNCESLILTFFPHPRMVLQEGSDIKLLNTIDERSILLDKLGLDNLIIHPFDKEFSRLSAEEFVKTILVDSFNIQKIIIGHDHRFGRNRTADIDDLILYGEKFGFEVEQISAQEINEVSISSTKIRNAILDGNMALANKYLGYDYRLPGIVSKGKQLGRTIGFPTANILINSELKLIPQDGVYAVWVCYNNAKFGGMLNIGNNPTIKDKGRSIEVNIFDFDKEIYTESLKIEFVNKLRNEVKFDGLEALKNQLHTDKQNAQSILNKFEFL